MDWSGFDMDRLYELYERHFDRLRADVIQVNRSLGSAQPDKTWMERVGRNEFEELLTTPSNEPAVIRRWVRCLIRGHEEEFPALRVA